jgi:hypothetical protein
MSDPRLVAAVNAIIDDAARQMSRAVVVARGIERLRPIFEGDERPAERWRRENAQALREMEALGNGPGAATKVAQRWSDNPDAHHRLAQRFRRLRRAKK